MVNLPPVSRKEELRRRIFGASVLIVVLALLLLAPPIVFMMAIVACGALMLHEWWRMTPRTLPWQLAGLTYVLPGTLSVIALHTYGLGLGGRPEIYLIAVIASVDIGAFAAGRTLGGPKLIPGISPNKTWAGLIGGIAAAMLTSIVLIQMTPLPFTALGAAGLGIVLAVLAQTGDFLESWVKRRCGVKDSGAIIPGHGGLLDRLDGYMLSAPALLSFVLLLRVGQ